MLGRNDYKTRAKYRMVFASQIGQEVLLDLLTELGYFDEVVEDHDALVLQNFAKRILKKCMILKEVNKKLFVEELFNKSVPDREE